MTALMEKGSFPGVDAGVTQGRQEGPRDVRPQDDAAGPQQATATHLRVVRPGEARAARTAPSPRSSARARRPLPWVASVILVPALGAVARAARALRTRSSAADPGGDAGMATAEYAIVTVAAAAFAGLLIVILRSDEVRGMLLGIIRGALSV